MKHKKNKMVSYFIKSKQVLLIMIDVHDVDFFKNLSLKIVVLVLKGQVGSFRTICPI